jgi:serine/threonine-protein kinase RsbW
VECRQAQRSRGPHRRVLQLETVYPSQRASAAQMRRMLRAYLAQQEVEAAVAYQVVLAADEAFANAVTHAGGGVIRVLACVSEGEASVEVQDAGDGFALPTSDPQAVPDVQRPSGRGVFLIERLMDEVSVESGRTGTTVRMVRRLA